MINILKSPIIKIYIHNNTVIKPFNKKPFIMIIKQLIKKNKKNLYLYSNNCIKKN